MRAVIQRVSEAAVSIEQQAISHISKGILILVGIEEQDTQEDIAWLSTKILSLRIFNDANGVMNLSVKDSHGDILVVSQFTLHASTKKGNRPSYIKAAKPPVALPLYDAFIRTLQTEFGKTIYTGQFGADMQVTLINDGPVTIIMDTKNKE